MTNFILFDQLTWPEVANLPRQLPIILPLGKNFSQDVLAAQLGYPNEAALLPAIPYGWENSLLPVSQSVLAALVANLVSGLREDGFTAICVSLPPGVDLGLDLPVLTGDAPLESHTEESAWDPARVVLMPVGHIEQHGYHLPLSTDTDIIGAISRAAAHAVPNLAVSLLVMPYGVSTHRSSFQGTFNCGGRAFEDFCLAAIDGLYSRGVRMVFLLSGHGGNCSFLTNVVKYAGERHPDMFTATTWLYLSGPQGIEALEKYRRSPRGGMGHACELETALMLALRPELVHMDRVVDEIDFVTTPSYYMDWVEGGALVANPPWLDDTTSGAYGAGSLATLSNGRIWLDTAVQEKVTQIREIVEQQRLRVGRRKTKGMTYDAQK